MIGKLVRSEITQQLLCDLVWKLHHRVQPGSLASVFQQIESCKAHKTLRSAEKAPTLSAGRKLNSPFSEWRGVLLIIQSFVVNSILFYFQLKVDGHVSRLDRDKYPVHPCIFI